MKNLLLRRLQMIPFFLAFMAHIIPNPNKSMRYEFLSSINYSAVGGGRNSLPNLFNFRILFVFPGEFHIRPETNARIMQLIKCFDYLCVCVAR